MYMFFWFFKQLYYCLRRIFKSGILLLLFFFIIFLFLFLKPSKIFAYTLPYNVNPVEYIEATGTQYIDTGVAPSSGNVGFELTYLETSFTSNATKTIIGSGGAANTGYLGFSRYNTTFQAYWGQSRSISGITAVPNTLYTVKFNVNNNRKVIINNFSADITSSVPSFTTRPMTLFCFTYDNGRVAYCDHARLYECKIYTGSTLVRHFVPVYDNTEGEACLYDVVTDTLYYNLGSGSFGYGANLYPYITNTSNSIVDFSFTDLNINADYLSYDDYYEMRFTYPNVNTSYTGSIEAYKYQDTNNRTYFSIPRYWFTSDIVVRDGSRISFDIIRYHREGNAVTSQTYSLGSFILDLTPEQEQAINEDSDKQLLSDINKNQEKTINAINDLNNSQQETTDSINDLHNDLMDDTTPSNDEFNLPSIEVNDITSSFFDTLFMGLYNAITSDEDASITFTLYSHTYTINSAQFNFLTDSRFQPLTTFLSLSWYGSIGYIIIKDIRKMIKKIKEGNIENVATDDIKADIV